MGDTADLNRRLEQVKRQLGSLTDSVTTERMTALVNELQQQIAAVEQRNADTRGSMLGRRH